MQSQQKGWGSDIPTFLVIATLGFLLTYLLGFFQPASSFDARLAQLTSLPGQLAERVARYGVGLASPPAESVPEPAELHYRVRAGDTLSRIAEAHDVSLRALAERNRLRDPDRLEIGEVLTIPGVSPPAVASVSAAPPAPAPVAAPASPPAAAEQATHDAREMQSVEELLLLAEEELRSAQFDEAFHSAKAAEWLLVGVDDPGSAPQRARLEVVRATVHSAYGKEAEARSSFERALDANPALELDPASSPPKLRRLLEDVRRTRAARQG